MPADAAAVLQRRTLHFDTIEQILADVDGLEKAQKQGKLRTLGNWSPGQNLGHLASWIDYSYDGVPFKIPFIARIVMRPMKNKFLYKPMRPGARIPRLKDGTLGIDQISFEEGLARLRKNLGRLKSEPPQSPHALFGRLNHDEWIAQHLRHSELHLSYLHAEP